MKNRMGLSADYRRLLNREMKIYSIIQKSFNEQKKFLEANVEDLYENYKYNIEIEWNLLNNEQVHLYPDKKSRADEEGESGLGGFRSSMGIPAMIDKLKKYIGKAVEKGYKTTYRILEPLLAENGFSYYIDKISNYENERGILNLSNYRGSISRTTKRDVIDALKNGIDNNKTPGEVANEIRAVNEKLFSKARARTIAVTEMRKAYEYGNYQPIEQLESVGIKMMKKRQTCDDARVRPEHMDCELLGRVRSNYEYESVGGVLYPPGGPNCRCTMLYEQAK